MLIPHTIPENEPTIRVGIILPEDSFTEITLFLPDEPLYQIITDNVIQIPSGKRDLTFQIEQEKILCSPLAISHINFRVEPREPYTIRSQAGILVKNVVAGRGFHWEKNIDVHLAGSLEIKLSQDKIILINELMLEEYIMCVATSEMSPACPSALIESQTIAARSWILAHSEQKHITLGIDVCNDDCCQRYQGTNNLTQQSISGANETSGYVLLYENRICDARYSKSCGGITETYPTIWGDKDLAYLKNMFDAHTQFITPTLPLSSEIAVRDWINSTPDVFCSHLSVNEETLHHYLGSVDERDTYFRWHVGYSQDEMIRLLNNKLNLNAIQILELIPVKRGGSGRLYKLAIRYVDAGNKSESVLIDSEFKIREALHSGFLYSSCFYIGTEYDKQGHPVNFNLYGAGWGHGVGYCQIGALGMALKDYTTPQILSHYYPGSVLKKIY